MLLFLREKTAKSKTIKILKIWVNRAMEILERKIKFEVSL
jgi:hypothetical protein